MDMEPRWEVRYTREGVAVQVKQSKQALTCHSYATELDALKECIRRNKKMVMRLRKVIREQSRVEKEVSGEGLQSTEAGQD